LNGATLASMLTETENNSAMSKVLAKLARPMNNNAALKPGPISIGVKYYCGRSNWHNFTSLRWLL
jgi:hypothetical protein